MRPTYSQEFKQEAIALSEQPGTTVAQVARELGIKEGALYRWRSERRVKGEEAFPGKGKLGPHDEEMRRLQRELERVKMECEILKKALRVFARPES